MPLNDKAWGQFIENAPASINIEDRRGLRGAWRKADGGGVNDHRLSTVELRKPGWRRTHSHGGGTHDLREYKLHRTQTGHRIPKPTAAICSVLLGKRQAR